MGYPTVDLTRFPLDLAAVAKVPKEIAARPRMLPLMINQGRLIVAVDRPSLIAELRSLNLAV
jgi:Type II secretion system (T2SS), protein E, N-terminal domain